MKAILLALSLLLSLKAFSKVTTYVGHFVINKTKIESNQAEFTPENFKGQKVNIVFEVNDENQDNPINIKRVVDESDLNGSGPIFTEVSMCAEEPADCDASSFVKLVSHDNSKYQSIAMTFGSQNDEYTQFFTLSGLREKEKGKSYEVIKGTGQVEYHF